MYDDISQLTPENQWDPAWNAFMPEPDISMLTPANQWDPIWDQVAAAYSEPSPLYNPLVVEGMAPPWHRPQNYTVGYGYTDPEIINQVQRLIGMGNQGTRGGYEQAFAFDRGPRADAYGFGPQEPYGTAYQPPALPQTPTTADLLAGFRPNMGGPRREGARSIEEMIQDYLGGPRALSPGFFQPYGATWEAPQDLMSQRR